MNDNQKNSFYDEDDDDEIHNPILYDIEGSPFSRTHANSEVSSCLSAIRGFEDENNKTDLQAILSLLQSKSKQQQQQQQHTQQQMIINNNNDYNFTPPIKLPAANKQQNNYYSTISSELYCDENTPSNFSSQSDLSIPSLIKQEINHNNNNNNFDALFKRMSFINNGNNQHQQMIVNDLHAIIGSKKNIILGGDFNYIEDREHDKNNSRLWKNM